MVRKRTINKPGLKSTSRKIKTKRRVSTKSKETSEFQRIWLSALTEAQPDIARQLEEQNKVEEININFTVKHYIVQYNAFISPINNPRASLILIPDPNTSAAQADIYFYETVDPSWKRYELKYIDSKPRLFFRFSMSEYSNLMDLLTRHGGVGVYYSEYPNGLILVYIITGHFY